MRRSCGASSAPFAELFCFDDVVQLSSYVVAFVVTAVEGQLLQLLLTA